jgi:RNA polymerase sigma-70 factor, ECF subfamily
MSELHTTTDSENALLLSVAAGDQQAFGQFYDRMAGPLYSLAIRMLGSEQEAQDMLQEGMEYLWRKAPNFDPTRSSAFTWCVMLFRSRLIDRMRRRAVRSRTLDKVTEQTDPAAHDDITALNALFRREDCLIVRKVMKTLAPEQQHLLSLAFFNGMTQQEIADQMGSPLGTVKSTIRRSLLALREKLAREGYQP